MNTTSLPNCGSARRSAEGSSTRPGHLPGRQPERLRRLELAPRRRLAPPRARSRSCRRPSSARRRSARTTRARAGTPRPSSRAPSRTAPARSRSGRICATAASRGTGRHRPRPPRHARHPPRRAPGPPAARISEADDERQHRQLHGHPDARGEHRPVGERRGRSRTGEPARVTPLDPVEGRARGPADAEVDEEHRGEEQERLARGLAGVVGEPDRGPAGRSLKPRPSTSPAPARRRRSPAARSARAAARHRRGSAGRCSPSAAPGVGLAWRDAR